MLSLLLVGVTQECRLVMWAPHSSGTLAIRPRIMPPDFHFTAASRFSLESVAQLYTRTFGDYFYNASISAALMQMFVRVEQIDLSRSPVLEAGGEPVGLATVGMRGERAYCKGFGIVVPFRGRGLAALLCAEVIRQARLAGARTLQLGVLKQNERAVRTYLSAGLHVWRELQSFEWDKRSDPSAEREVSAVEAVEPHALLGHYASLHPVTPVWGRDLRSLQEMDDLSGIALPVKCGPAPYVLYEPDEEGTIKIMDIAAPRVEQAEALLSHLKRMHRRIVCNNEPDVSPMLDAFAAGVFGTTRSVSR
jgi:ribosomal protein S18 acetylase RimI-like enzyme